jgi:hypothetical protein
MRLEDAEVSEHERDRLGAWCRGCWDIPYVLYQRGGMVARPATFQRSSATFWQLCCISLRDGLARDMGLRIDHREGLCQHRLNCQLEERDVGRTEDDNVRK